MSDYSPIDRPSAFAREGLFDKPKAKTGGAPKVPSIQSDVERDLVKIPTTTSRQALLDNKEAGSIVYSNLNQIVRNLQGRVDNEGHRLYQDEDIKGFLTSGQYNNTKHGKRIKFSETDVDNIISDINSPQSVEAARGIVASVESLHGGVFSGKKYNEISDLSVKALRSNGYNAFTDESGTLMYQDAVGNTHKVEPSFWNGIKADKLAIGLGIGAAGVATLAASMALNATGIGLAIPDELIGMSLLAKAGSLLGISIPTAIGATVVGGMAGTLGAAGDNTQNLLITKEKFDKTNEYRKLADTFATEMAMAPIGYAVGEIVSLGLKSAAGAIGKKITAFNKQPLSKKFVTKPLNRAYSRDWEQFNNDMLNRMGIKRGSDEFLDIQDKAYKLKQTMGGNRDETITEQELSAYLYTATPEGVATAMNFSGSIAKIVQDRILARGDIARGTIFEQASKKVSENLENFQFMSVVKDFDDISNRAKTFYGESLEEMKSIADEAGFKFNVSDLRDSVRNNLINGKFFGKQVEDGMDLFDSIVSAKPVTINEIEATQINKELVEEQVDAIQNKWLSSLENIQDYEQQKNSISSSSISGTKKKYEIEKLNRAIDEEKKLASSVRSELDRTKELSKQSKAIFRDKYSRVMKIVDKGRGKTYRESVLSGKSMEDINKELTELKFSLTPEQQGQYKLDYVVGLYQDINEVIGNITDPNDRMKRVYGNIKNSIRTLIGDSVKGMDDVSAQRFNEIFNTANKTYEGWKKFESSNISKILKATIADSKKKAVEFKESDFIKIFEFMGGEAEGLKSERLMQGGMGILFDSVLDQGANRELAESSMINYVVKRNMKKAKDAPGLIADFTGIIGDLERSGALRRVKSKKGKAMVANLYNLNSVSQGDLFGVSRNAAIKYVGQHEIVQPTTIGLIRRMPIMGKMWEVSNKALNTKFGKRYLIEDMITETLPKYLDDPTKKLNFDRLILSYRKLGLNNKADLDDIISRADQFKKEWINADTQARMLVDKIPEDSLAYSKEATVDIVRTNMFDDIDPEDSVAANYLANIVTPKKAEKITIVGNRREDMKLTEGKLGLGYYVKDATRFATRGTGRAVLRESPAIAARERSK